MYCDTKPKEQLKNGQYMKNGYIEHIIFHYCSFIPVFSADIMLWILFYCLRVCRGRDCMVVEITNYPCNHYPSPQKLWVRILLIARCTLCDKACHWFVVFSGYSGFLPNKTDRHDITEILLKVALNTIILLVSKYHVTDNCGKVQNVMNLTFFDTEH